MLFENAEEHNTSLREIDALKKSLGQAEKKAEVTLGAKERLELEMATAAEAKERLQREATDREEQLATAADAREREVAGKLMAAAKAVSVEYLHLRLFWFSCLSYAVLSLIPSLYCLRCHGHRV